MVPPKKATGKPKDKWASKLAYRKRSDDPNGAWAITEILETILAFLPMSDLLLAQGVCRRWRDVIARSVVLQELLFLRPKPQKLSDGIQTRQFNPLLMEHMPVWFGPNSAYRHLNRLEFLHSPSRIPFLRRDASWRKMLLAQPPFLVYERARIRNGENADQRISVGFVEQPDGVRMGQAYDAVIHCTDASPFHTLLDGRIAHDAGYSKYEFESGPPRQRFYGGINKFTVITMEYPLDEIDTDQARERKELEVRQRTSADHEPEDVVLSDSYPSYRGWDINGYGRM